MLFTLKEIALLDIFDNAWQKGAQSEESSIDFRISQALRIMVACFLYIPARARAITGLYSPRRLHLKEQILRIFCAAQLLAF